jgi:hypothetical protein
MRIFGRYKKETWNLFAGLGLFVIFYLFERMDIYP